MACGYFEFKEILLCVACVFYRYTGQFYRDFSTVRIMETKCYFESFGSFIMKISMRHTIDDYVYILLCTVISCRDICYRIIDGWGHG